MSSFGVFVWECSGKVCVGGGGGCGAGGGGGGGA